MPRRVAIIGFGKIAECILDAYLSPTDGPRLQNLFTIVAIWNRTPAKLDNEKINREWIVTDLADLHLKAPDLIIEVSHPDVLIEHGESFLKLGDLFVGSPTAFANADFFERICKVASVSEASPFGLYLPAGALWGSGDIAKMGERNSIVSASITMRKPVHSMKLLEPLLSALEAFKKDDSGQSECVLYHGPVADLCALAPNNVNTMASLAVATQLGFHKTIGRLVADKTVEAHVIDVEIVGRPLTGRSDPFKVTSTRYNPCNPNEVTGTQTYASFLASLKHSTISLGKGIHFV